jgi:hypothetical protein
MRRMLLERGPLVEARIGASPHGHLAVRPGLAGQPFDNVIAVARFVGERLEAALGVAAPPHIHQREDIAVTCEVGGAILVAVADVRREGEYHRQRRGHRLGLKDGGVEVDAVAQGDLDSPEHVDGDGRIFGVERD